MAGKDDQFEFNAPKYVDFMHDNFDTPDDSYFEYAKETPKAQRTSRRSAAKKSVKTPKEVEQKPQNTLRETTTDTTDTQETQHTPQPKRKPTEEEKKSPTASTNETKLTLTEQMKELTRKTEQLLTECKKVKEPTEQGEETAQPTEDLREQEPPKEHITEQQIETEQESTEHMNKTEQLEAEKHPSEKQIDQDKEQEPTEHMKNTEQLEAEKHPSEEQTEQEHESEPVTPSQSVVKGRRKESQKLSSVGVRQSPRLSAISKALRRSNASRRSSGSTQATSRTQDSHVKKVQSQKKTVRRVSGVSGLKEEDKKELETLATFRNKITANKKRKDTQGHSQPLRPTKPQEFHFATDQRLRKSHTEEPAPVTSAPRPTRSGPTKPQEFHFATDARLKGKEQGKEEAEGPVEFVRSLRSSTPTLNKDSAACRGPTIPQPFNLSESRKPLGQEPKKFVSMAELNNKFYIQTPERFRNKRTTSTEDMDDAKKPRGCTVAHTPNLSTGRRRRSLSLMSFEEREQQAFEEAQKHAFKARPVNKKVLQAPPSGYRVERKLPTVPEPFNITDSKKSHTPLLPESLTEDTGEDANLSVTSLPYGGMPLKGKRLTTKVQPFTFDSRDKMKLMKKQEKIKKMLEEEKNLAEFHAQPMPVFEDGIHGVPAKKPPTPTQVKPFHLHSDHRGSLKQERFKQQMEEEAQAQDARRKFHAQSDQVLHVKPFIPEKSNKPLTEISNITLSTEVRASERSDYDHQRKTLEEEMLAAKKMDEERRAAEELVEVTRLRREAVHKAQPMPKSKPMVIQPAPQVPTVPRTPNFATESRLRSRSQANSSTSNSTFSLES